MALAGQEAIPQGLEDFPQMGFAATFRRPAHPLASPWNIRSGVARMAFLVPGGPSHLGSGVKWRSNAPWLEGTSGSASSLAGLVGRELRPQAGRLQPRSLL